MINRFLDEALLLLGFDLEGTLYFIVAMRSRRNDCD